MNETIMKAVINEILKSIQNGTEKEKACALNCIKNRQYIIDIYNKVIEDGEK